MNQDIFKRFITTVISNDNVPESYKEIQKNLIINFLYQEYHSKSIKVSKIEEFLHKNFSLTITTEEIESCIEGVDQVDKHIDKDGISYQISPEHYTKMYSQEKKNLDYFVDQYKRSICEEIECDIGESIYKFLYLVSNNNLLDFQKVVSNELYITPEDEISKEFSSIQIKHINHFLQWEDQKNWNLIWGTIKWIDDQRSGTVKSLLSMLVWVLMVSLFVRLVCLAKKIVQINTKIENLNHSIENNRKELHD